MTKKEHIVVGLDIGTTKICAVVGEILEDRSVNVIGIGSHRSTGLRKGMVVNMESTVEPRAAIPISPQAVQSMAMAFV